MPEKLKGGMEVLEISDCEAFLRRGGVGLLAMAGIDAPIMRPVNYAYHEGALLIRTGEGQILEAACAGEPASFAITEIDHFEHSGWSVVVVGALGERSKSDPTTEAPLRPWVRDDKEHFVGLSILDISGRRIADHRRIQ